MVLSNIDKNEFKGINMQKEDLDKKKNKKGFVKNPKRLVVALATFLASGALIAISAVWMRSCIDTEKKFQPKINEGRKVATEVLEEGYKNSKLTKSEYRRQSYFIKKDSYIAKNYLNEEELKAYNEAKNNKNYSEKLMGGACAFLFGSFGLFDSAIRKKYKEEIDLDYLKKSGEDQEKTM